MRKTKILYIADANSFHDVKWIKYFSNQTDQYKCFILSESTIAISDSSKKILFSHQIDLLEQINPISISNPIRTIKSIVKFRRLLADIKPDIIHVLFATPHALWLNFTDTPSIVSTRGSDILNVIPSLLKTNGLKGFYDRFLYRKFENAFSKAKYVSGTSNKQIITLRQSMGLSNPKLVRTGVEVSKISSLVKEELIEKSILNTPIILSPRFMNPIYNIDLQVESIYLLSKSVVDKYTFIFIKGRTFDKDYFEKVQVKLKDLELKRNLKYRVYDFVDQETLWMLLKKSSLCLMTPISDGTPNSALEALAAKKPLIIPALDYDKDLFENSCIQLKSYNSAELKDKIEYALLSYPNELLETGYRNVRQFGDNTIEMSKIEQLYKSIIES
jgi:hypothetical protein